MDSTTLVDFSGPPHVLSQLVASLSPHSVGDYIALTLLAVLGAAYLLRGITWDKKDPHYYRYFERPQEREGGTVQQGATRDIAQKLDESNNDCVVFWGSQSGTAEGFAARLAKECRLRFSLPTITADLSDYDPETIIQIPKSKLAVFILSTYGEGDPSDNTAGFWDWVNHAQGLPLKDLHYAAFGLGNSNYKHYNRVLTVVAEKLDVLGATQLLLPARADDALRSTEEDFVAWKSDLFGMFKGRLQLEEKPAEYQPMFEVVEDYSLEPINLHTGEPVHPRDNPKAAASSSLIKSLPIKETRELYTSGDRNCIHMELDINEHAQLVYKTGDHLAVWPKNTDGEVELLLNALSMQARQHVPVLLRSLDADTRIKVPSPTTISTLFRHYLEIGGPISRETILDLVQFAPSAEIKAFLLDLGHSRSRFAEYAAQNHLTLGRLLALASPANASAWSNLPLSFIIESLPCMQPRYYSISSSSVLSPRRIAITALVSIDSLAASPLDPSSTRSKIHGLTTNYLLAHSRAIASQQANSPTSSATAPTYTLPSPHINAHIRKSKFKLPISSRTPLIMIAAGTGLAPFRAFISERAKLYATRGRDNTGEMALFFGCRNENEDWIYQDEIEACRQKMEGKFSVRVAFSRPTSTRDERGASVNGEGKKYVQNSLSQIENAKEIVRLLDDGANLYICGRTQMAREVGRVVIRVLMDQKGMSEVEATEEVEGMKRRGKWREDVWG